MRLEERFEQYRDDFLEFDKVENKLHNRADVCAYLLLDQLVPDTKDIVSSAEHDEIWLSVDCEQLEAVVTDEQIRTLVRCGVRYDDDYNSLCMFV